MRLFFASLSLLLLCGCRAPVSEVRQKQLFVVIDDAGLALEETQRFLDIPVAMTIAVLPHQKQTREVCAAITRDPQKEIILHQPMEARNADKNPGVGAIYNETSPGEVKSIMARNLASVPEAVGVNNHMGSRVTENPVLMREVLRFCKANDLFFLDSKTAYNSMVKRVAQESGVHFEERHVFLDVEHDQAYVRRMWSAAVARAQEHGYAVVIGHAWSAETAAAIRDSFLTLENQGYSFRRLSELYE